MAALDIQTEPFPAATATAVGAVNGVQTAVMRVSFADKIVVTVSQGGRLGHWIHVSLPDATQSAALPAHFATELDAELPDSGLLPMPHLTATTVLGGTLPERDVEGQVLATQIASAVLMKEEGERRMVVVGLGLEKGGLGGREGWEGVVELVLGVL